MKKILTLIFVSIFACNVYANTRDGLVGWWKLDDTTATAFDSSWNRKIGTPTGTSIVSNCVRNICRSFNGVDGQQVNTANDPYAKSVFSGGLTLAAWVNPAATQSHATPGNQIVSIEGAYVIDVDSGGKFGFEIDGSGTDVVTSASIPNGVWTYIVMTASGAGSLRSYVNGVADSTGSQSYYDIDTLTRALSIGGHPTATTFNFNGQIDDVRVYNRALTIQEIKDLYNNGIRLNYVPGT